MDSKTMLEGILWDLKALGDLFLHGSIESGTKNVHTTFKDSLNDILTMQNELYSLMSDEEMYTVSNVSQSKLDKSRCKYDEKLKGE